MKFATGPKTHKFIFFKKDIHVEDPIWCRWLAWGLFTS